MHPQDGTGPHPRGRGTGLRLGRTGLSAARVNPPGPRQVCTACAEAIDMEVAHWDCWGWCGDRHINRPEPNSTPEHAMDLLLLPATVASGGRDSRRRVLPRLREGAAASDATTSTLHNKQHDPDRGHGPCRCIGGRPGCRIRRLRQRGQHEAVVLQRLGLAGMSRASARPSLFGKQARSCSMRPREVAHEALQALRTVAHGQLEQFCSQAVASRQIQSTMTACLVRSSWKPGTSRGLAVRNWPTASGSLRRIFACILGW